MRQCRAFRCAPFAGYSRGITPMAANHATGRPGWRIGCAARGRDLSYRIAAGATCGHIRISQPSLGHQIQQLEAELGVALLERTRSRVELTDAGGVFLEKRNRRPS
jgi:hypothetical protein